MQASRIAFHKCVLRPQAEFDLEIFRGNVFAANFVGALQDFVHARGFEAELEFAFRNASHIEKIVDQARFEFDVAANHFQRPAYFR